MRPLLLPLLSLLGLALAADAPPTDDAATTEADSWDVQAPHGPTHEVALDLREGTWMSVAVRGDRVIFDLLGDLWSMPLSGGDATRLTQGAAWDLQPAFSPDGTQVAYVSDAGGSEQIWLMNADGTGARQLTDDHDARFTEPVWDPSGRWIFGRRRTVDTRSIGVTEIWQIHLDGGKGFALTSLDSTPHAAEAQPSKDGKYLYFSSRAGRFTYDENPVGGLWSIVRLDRVTSEVRDVVSGAGSAARPTLSPDGKSMAFISRDRNHTVLELLDLASGQRRVLDGDLGVDQMEGFALHGLYPTMAWLGDQELLLWKKGKLVRLRLDGTTTEVPFHAAGSWRLTDVPRWQRAVPDQVQAKVIRWPVQAPDGRIAFSAMGQLWVRGKDGAISALSKGTGYAPAWSPDGKTLAWTSWSDTEGGRLHLTRDGKDEVLPIDGQLVNPAWSEDGSQLVVLRGGAGNLDEDLGQAPWFEIVLLTRTPKKTWESRVVTTTPNRGPGSHAPRLHLHGGRVWYLEDRDAAPRTPGDSALVSVQVDGKDKRDHLLFDGADEAVISPDFTRVAYQQHHEVWVTALPTWGQTLTVADGGLPTHKLSPEPGTWLSWTPDSKAVLWSMGALIKRLPLDGLGSTPETEKDDTQEDDQKVKEVDDPKLERIPVDLTLPRAKPTATVAYTHARAITMRGDEVIEDATLVVQGDRLQSVTAGGAPPAGAEVVDLRGKTVLPGLIDVHAHLHFSSGDVLPEQEWRYQTALDFGVTTVHDPSASTELVFTQAERVEAGLMVGPRVYSTGSVLYGALSNDGADTPDADAARWHVRRMQASGAMSVKVYQQSRREQRQWYTAACRELQVLCVAEGGGDLWQDLNMMVDGIHADEHALSVSPLYADVLGLFAGSKTADTLGTAHSPTLLVAYGGLSGEHYFYQKYSPLDDPRLLRHYPRRLLDARAWRLPIMAQDEDWNHQSVARDVAHLAERGVLTTLGAHGQLQGLGGHWELWGLAGSGAMTPMQALRSATYNGARYLGLDQQLGSLEPGKLADFVVLDANPLDDIHNSTKISLVVKNGSAYP